MSDNPYPPNVPYGQTPQPPQPPAGPPPVWPPAGPPPVPPYASAPKPGQTWNALAIVSLVSAFFISLVAIVTGHIALSQIRRTREKGHGLALAGVILGYAGVVVGLMVGVLVLVFFVWGVNRAIEAVPTYDPNSGASPSSSDLDWDAGQDLSSGDRPSFTDPFATDPAWVVSQADDGNGGWAYASSDSECTLTFHQGALTSVVDPTPGDDRATTESFLAIVDGATLDTVTSSAVDNFLDYGADGTSYVDVLTLSGTDKDGRNWITAGRAFSKTGTGLYLDLTCQPDATLDDYYYSVIDEAGVVLR